MAQDLVGECSGNLVKMDDGKNGDEERVLDFERWFFIARRADEKARIYIYIFI